MTKKQFTVRWVKSESSNEQYALLICKESGLACECSCPDRVRRGRRAGRACKHMKMQHQEARAAKLALTPAQEHDDRLPAQPVNTSNASEKPENALVSSMGNDTALPSQEASLGFSEAQVSTAVVSVESRLAKMGLMAGSHRGGKLAGLVS